MGFKNKKLVSHISRRLNFQWLVIFGATTFAAAFFVTWKSSGLLNSNIHPICFKSLKFSENNDTKVSMRLLTDKLRAYSTLSAYIQHCKHETTNDANRKMLQYKHIELERSLFPFLSPRSALEWRDSFRRGRGLVMCVSAAYLRFALTLLENLRMLKSSLPVEVFYKAGELQPSQKLLLETYGVKLVDIYTLINPQLMAFSNSKYLIKPFALFLASFSETILVDADTLFFRKPELLFEHDGYKKTGTLFFLDRYYSKPHKPRGSAWFDENMPQPISDRFKSNQFYRGLSNHLMESGVVLVDKSRNYIGALAACRIMTWYDYQSWFGAGDKESFWLGFELLEHDYAFHPMRPGTLGWLANTPNKNSSEVCGNLMHPGDDGRPFWWNGGIVIKTWGDNRPAKYEAFGIEGERDTLRVDHADCLEDATLTPLNSYELTITLHLSKFWNETFKVIPH